jgi:UDP-glucose 4-epimerase
MNIAVTGGSGRLGRVVIETLLTQGHTLLNIDRTPPPEDLFAGRALRFAKADLTDLAALKSLLRESEAVIHLAAYPGPGDHLPGEVYLNNTTASYNLLQAAASLGIRRICLASSVNALGGIASRAGRFDYFPVDEAHPTYNEDDYSLSKWVMEQQASSFARRFPQAAICSLRLHALPDTPPERQALLESAEAPAARGLWGFTLISEAARAFDLALQAGFSGHEVFFITARSTTSAIPSLELAHHAYPDVPIRGNLSGHASFFNCSKAARLLGWVHADVYSI